MRRDPGSWLPQPFSFHLWVALGGRLDFHSSWSLSRKGLGTPYPSWAAGVLPLAALPLHWAVRLAWKGWGPLLAPSPGASPPRIKPSLWRGVAPGASLGMCSRPWDCQAQAGLERSPALRGREWAWLAQEQGSAGVPFLKHRTGRPRAIQGSKRRERGRVERGLHASLGRGR